MDAIDELIQALPHADTKRHNWSGIAKRAMSLRAKGYGLSQSYEILVGFKQPGLDGTPENKTQFVKAMSKRFTRAAQ